MVLPTTSLDTAEGAGDRLCSDYKYYSEDYWALQKEQELTELLSWHKR